MDKFINFRFTGLVISFFPKTFSTYLYHFVQLFDILNSPIVSLIFNFNASLYRSWISLLTIQQQNHTIVMRWYESCNNLNMSVLAGNFRITHCTTMESGDDVHYCLRCDSEIKGLMAYVEHRQSQCSEADKPSSPENAGKSYIQAVFMYSCSTGFSFSERNFVQGEHRMLS